MLHKTNSKWLIFFYSVPSKPVSNRMKIWRRLSKAGALHLKGAVYVLPHNEENFELCQWLVSEVTAMDGESAFVNVQKVETMKDGEIIALFNHQRETDYRNIEKKLEELERKINSIRKGGGIKDIHNLLEELDKYEKEFRDIKKIDFFSTRGGNTLQKKLETLNAEIKKISETAVKTQHYIITSKQIMDYQNKTWVTRKSPFVDRMACAWLIRKFIDKRAIFEFIDEKDIGHLNKNTIAFDIRGGEFTHVGDMCSFEVLLKAFNIKNRQVGKIAAIVHEIDLKDDKYKNPETKGIEDILIGIRKTTIEDLEVLEKGVSLFELLYAAKT